MRAFLKNNSADLPFENITVASLCEHHVVVFEAADHHFRVCFEISHYYNPCCLLPFFLFSSNKGIFFFFKFRGEGDRWEN